MLAFSGPLYIKLQSAEEKRTIADVWAASDCLRYDWPTTRGPRYLAALQVVEDALEGNRQARCAERAFMLAAQEAKIAA